MGLVQCGVIGEELCNSDRKSAGPRLLLTDVILMILGCHRIPNLIISNLTLCSYCNPLSCHLVSTAFKYYMHSVSIFRNKDVSEN